MSKRDCHIISGGCNKHKNDSDGHSTMWLAQEAQNGEEMSGPVNCSEKDGACRQDQWDAAHTSAQSRILLQIQRRILLQIAVTTTAPSFRGAAASISSKLAPELDGH